MKVDQSILRRLDQELIGHQQQIAMHQVEIARLQDTRRLLMGLVEDDQAAADRAKAGPELLPGSHAKPMLIVRKVGSGEADQSDNLGIVASGRRKGLPRLRKGRSGVKMKPKGQRPLTRLKSRVLDAVEPGGKAISPRDLGDQLGLSRDDADRKPLWNTLYQMRQKGLIKRDQIGQYYRPATNGH